MYCIATVFDLLQAGICRKILALPIAALAVLPISEANAQHNFDVFPGDTFMIEGGNGLESLINVINYKNGTLYQCDALVEFANSQFAVTCGVSSPQLPLLNGTEITTLEVGRSGTAPPVGGSYVSGGFPTFWQLNQDTGQVQVCVTFTYPNGPRCQRAYVTGAPQ